MPLCYTCNLNGAEVSVWKITEGEEELCALAGLDYAVEHRRFSSAGRRLEWLAVRALLMQVYTTNELCYSPAGKPSLVSRSGYISISHTTGYAVVAFSPVHEVGVDAELRSRHVGAVARRFMRDEELHGIPPECVNDAKLLRWVASEALFKLVGDLGGNYRDNIVLSAFPCGESGHFTLALRGLPGHGDDCYGASFLFVGDLLLVLCCKQIT